MLNILITSIIFFTVWAIFEGILLHYVCIYMNSALPWDSVSFSINHAFKSGGILIGRVDDMIVTLVVVIIITIPSMIPFEFGKVKTYIDSGADLLKCIRSQPVFTFRSFKAESITRETSVIDVG